MCRGNESLFTGSWSHYQDGRHANTEEKMFEYYGNMHVNCPRVGAYELLGTNFFQNH